MGLVITMGIFFIVVTVIFVAIAVFLPEWMGITGDKAKRIIAEQQQDPASSSTPPQAE
ncbi:hypothetical protein [Bdellovibrio bacteriovorus]|uniref:hypothetical protein n=1 Tax=Bdellovibrio TaxID=958 RepID=UPI0035A90FF4